MAAQDPEPIGGPAPDGRFSDSNPHDPGPEVTAKYAGVPGAKPRFADTKRGRWLRALVSFMALGLFASGLVGLLAFRLIAPGTDTLQLGLVAPLTGPMSGDGTEMVAGAQAFVSMANEAGLLADRRLELVVRDEGETADSAIAAVKGLAAETDVIAVLGHLTDETADVTWPVYQEEGLSVLNGRAGRTNVTFDSPYAFRVGLTTEIQGKLLAHYVSRVLNEPELIVISDGSAYGDSLLVIFDEELSVLNRLGDSKMKVVDRLAFDGSAADASDQITALAEGLKTRYLGQMILLATGEQHTAELIQKIQDRPRRRLGREIAYRFIGGDILSRPALAQAFKGLRREQFQPGVYLEGVLAVAPFLREVSNAEAIEFQRRFEEANKRSPSTLAAGYFDAASAAAAGIQQISIDILAEGNRNSIRNAFRDRLSAINTPDQSLQGVSGPYHFDRDGNAVRWVPVGVYRNGELVSPPIQLVPVSSRETMDRDNVLQVGGRYFTKTKIVHTGLQVNEISNIDLAARRFDADLNVWFRYQGELDFNDITFPSADGDLALGEPVAANDKDGISYRLFRVSSTFKLDQKEADESETIRDLSLQLRHAKLNRDNLILVPDLQGMDGSAGGDFRTQVSSSVNLDGLEDWSVSQIRMFQDVEPIATLGDPRFGGEDVEGYSRLNLTVTLQTLDITVLDELGVELAAIIFLIAGIVLSLLGLITVRFPGNRMREVIWLPQALLYGVMVLAAETMVIGWLMSQPAFQHYQDVAITVFRVLWWLVPAWLLVRAVEFFFWTPLEQRTGRAVPRVVRAFSAGIIYTLAVLGVIAFVFDQTVTSLLATSGVVAMIVGLAIQMNLSNVFSGIAINVETPFRMGDWIKVAEYEPGKVVAITWRTTRIETLDKNIICIPNSIASDSFVENFSYPEESYRTELLVHLDPGARPIWVEKILHDAITATAGIKKDPKPEIVFVGVMDWSATYAIRFFCDNYPSSIEITARAWRDVVRNLRYAGFVSVIHEEFILFHLEDKKGNKPDPEALLIDDVPIFEPFNAEQKALVRQRLGHRSFEAGDHVIRAGDPGASLFIVSEGAMLVEIEAEDGSMLEVNRLGPGDFFGEMALLTGEPRAATITAATPSRALEISHDHIQSILNEYPEIADDLSRILTKRTLENIRSRNAHAASQVEEQSLAKEMLGKIISFFAMDKASTKPSDRGPDAPKPGPMPDAPQASTPALTTGTPAAAAPRPVAPPPEPANEETPAPVISTGEKPAVEKPTVIKRRSGPLSIKRKRSKPKIIAKPVAVPPATAPGSDSTKPHPKPRIVVKNS
ncbi:MAG: ABC transporter substrate-binding protein [Magnetovibrionaceae bacterium]